MEQMATLCHVTIRVAEGLKTYSEGLHKTSNHSRHITMYFMGGHHIYFITWRRTTNNRFGLWQKLPDKYQAKHDYELPRAQILISEAVLYLAG